MSAPQALCPIISSFEPLRKPPKTSTSPRFQSAFHQPQRCKMRTLLLWTPMLLLVRSFSWMQIFSRNCIHYCLDRRDKLTRGDDEWGNLLPQLKYRTWTEHPEFDDSLRIDMCNSRHLQHTRRDRKVTTSKTCDCTSFPFFLSCFTST